MFLGWWNGGIGLFQEAELRLKFSAECGMKREKLCRIGEMAQKGPVGTAESCKNSTRNGGIVTPGKPPILR